MVTCKLYVNDQTTVKMKRQQLQTNTWQGKYQFTQLNKVYVIETSHYTMTISTIVIEQMFIFCHWRFTYQF